MKENMEEPYYGYRINTYITAVLIGGGIVSIALAIIFTIIMYSTWVLILCWVLGVILLISGVFWHLSMGFANNPKKARLLEDSFLNMLRSVWDGKGRVLDIGTGRGRAAVEIARRFPQARVTGVDIWPKFWALWGQTKAGAEKNATIEKVSDRCTFQYGNALDLPFKDEEFQMVVSSFCFHEVHVPDRTVLLKEVVRVLAPGGTFVIGDLFPRGYTVKNVPDLLRKVQLLGVEDVNYKTTKEAGANLGRLAHIWGVAYLSGRKKNSYG